MTRGWVGLALVADQRQALQNGPVCRLLCLNLEGEDRLLLDVLLYWCHSYIVSAGTAAAVQRHSYIVSERHSYIVSR